MKAIKLYAAAAIFLLASRAGAYVTSAILEYSVDDQAIFYLNGSQINQKSRVCAQNFEVLSTSDGTLPMELFNPYGDNTLAIEDYDLEGYQMSLSYRLTVHTSEGDPIVLWSTPGEAKMLHLHKSEPDPSGWTRPDFNDSKWPLAVEGTAIKAAFFSFFQLVDPTFAGPLGINPYVPRLSHVFNMDCNTQDHNLFRTHFRFPDHPAKVTAIVNPAKAVQGQTVAVRLIPGPDSAELSQFNILAWLPTGLDFVSASERGSYDQKLRRIAWNFGSRDLDVRYAKMPAASIIGASGWKSPERLLGPAKEGKGSKKLNTPDAVWNDGAIVTANHPGWFKLAPHGVDLSKWRPLILGVIFHSQMKVGGQDTATVREVDSIRLNYSVDGSTKEALADDVEVSRMSTHDYWFDGYYDATEDRKWTWDDISRLAVKLNVRARGSVDDNLVASIVATVKYYVPAKASPYFFAKVSDPRCETIQLNAGIFRAGSPMTSADPVDLAVNSLACAPTPTPMPTWTPVPKQQMVLPTPQPTVFVGKVLASDIRFGLSSPTANPEPFNYAGTFITFGVQKDVDVSLNIYSGTTGKVVRQMKAGSFRPGDNNQIFFNALDDSGQPLEPGAYIVELVAEKNGHREVRNATFHFIKGKR